MGDLLPLGAGYGEVQGRSDLFNSSIVVGHVDCGGNQRQMHACCWHEAASRYLEVQRTADDSSAASANRRTSLLKLTIGHSHTVDGCATRRCPQPMGRSKAVGH